MTFVRDVLRGKAGTPATVASSTSVLDAAQLMTSRSIGSVLVVDDGALVGIFTERDVLRRVVAEVRDPASTPVRDVMTGLPLLTCTEETRLDDCRQLMSERRIRHLPVLHGNTIRGMLTSGDLLAWQLHDQQMTIQQLEGFVFDNR